MATFCPQKFLAPPSAAAEETTGNSFAQVVSRACDIQVNQLPPRVIKGDTISVKISQLEYEAGLEDCKHNLHGRLMLRKGDSPVTTKILKEKLNAVWKDIKN